MSLLGLGSEKVGDLVPLGSGGHALGSTLPAGLGQAGWSINPHSSTICPCSLSQSPRNLGISGSKVHNNRPNMLGSKQIHIPSQKPLRGREKARRAGMEDLGEEPVDPCLPQPGSAKWTWVQILLIPFPKCMTKSR